jgi:hypothetical protein
MNMPQALPFNLITFLAVLLVPLVAVAEPGQTFQLQESPAPPPNLDMGVSGAQLLREELGQSGQDLGSECQAMLQQIDGMGFAPERKAALWQRYRAQCQSGMDGRPVYTPSLPE